LPNICYPLLHIEYYHIVLTCNQVKPGAIHQLWLHNVEDISRSLLVSLTRS